MKKGTRLEFSPMGFDANGDPNMGNPPIYTKNLTFDRFQTVESSVKVIGIDSNGIINVVSAENCKAYECEDGDKKALLG